MVIKSFHAVRVCLCVLVVSSVSRSSFSAERTPPIRTGLWVTQKASENELAGFEEKVRANPYLAGVCLTASWNEIEKESGKIDFSAIDKAVAALRRIGKKYELALKPGASTPSFVYQEGAQSFQTRVSNPHRPNYGETITIPIPWNPIYQRNFSRVIEKLGERYAGDPLCVGVVLTCANFMSKEMHLPKRPEDRAKWREMGNYEQKLLEVYKKYTDEWGKAFPKQAVSLHLAKVLDVSSVFYDRIIDYGLSKYPERFTLQNCQLTGRKEDTGTLSYDLVQKYRDRAHRGFQSLAGFSHGGERMGSVAMAALNVVHAQGEYWELWRGDGLSRETSAAVDKAWREAKQLGYDGYKKKLVSESSYREQSDDHYRAKAKGGGRGRGRRGKADREEQMPEPE